MNRKKELLFEEAYKNYSRLLLKIIYSYVGNYDDCQDILQEVYYRLLYKAPKLKSEEHQKRWLVKTAINLSKDHLKSFWQRKTESLKDEYTEKMIQEDNSVEELIIQLPDKYKEVIVLYYFCGYHISEIGSMLKISQSAVKMRLSRAREMLRLEMEEQ